MRQNKVKSTLEYIAQQNPDFLTPEQRQLLISPAPSTPAYIPSYTTDILIYATDSQKDWLEKLLPTLENHLAQILKTRGQYRLRCELNPIPHFSTLLAENATILIIYTPDLTLEKTELDNLTKEQRKRIFWLECAEESLGTAKSWSYRFWQTSEKNYFRQLEQLAEELAGVLIEQRKSYEFTQKNPINSETKIGWVYLNIGADDAELRPVLKAELEKMQVEHSVSIDPKMVKSAAEIDEDNEENLKGCDLMIVVYGKVTYQWVRKQLLRCRRMQEIRKDNPIELMIVHDDKTLTPDKPDITQDFSFKNLKIYPCPPYSLQHYLTEYSN